MIDRINRKTIKLVKQLGYKISNNRVILKTMKLNSIGFLSCVNQSSICKDSILGDYDAWISDNEPKENNLGNFRKECDYLNYKPQFSIITFIYKKSDATFLQSSIDSVMKQTYNNWILYIANIGSVSPSVKKMLTNYSKKDERIKLKVSEEGLQATDSHNELLRYVEGEYIVFLNHEDVLASFALQEIAKLLNQDRADIIYSDGDKIDSNGHRFFPIFKPSWSPYTLRSYNYIKNFSTINKSIIDKLEEDGFNFDSTSGYEFLLRATEISKKIKNVNKILYHSRSQVVSEILDNDMEVKDREADRKAIQEHCRRLGEDVIVLDEEGTAGYKVRYYIIGQPMVSIIIPIKDRVELTRNCINSIINRSAYKNYEIIIVDNNSVSDDTKSFLEYIKEQYKFIKIIKYKEDFNWSKINNFAIKYSEGDILIFLNNDIEILTDDWMEALIEYAMRKDVGAVGALLLYPDKRIQHCGVVLGMNGWADHVCSGLTLQDAKKNSYCNLLVSFVRNVSAVTGACLCIEKRKFLNIGLFNENFVIGGGDVEFCLRALEHGYSNIYLPHVNLIHYESASRKNIDIPPQDYDNSYKAYSRYRFRDPYYSENFDYFSKIPRIGNRKYNR